MRSPFRIGILLAAACLLATPARALADDALYTCHKAPPDAKLTVQFTPDLTLRDLAVWVTGFSCKSVVFDAEAARRATKLALIAPSAMTPAQATRLFVDVVQKTGLAVTERADAFVVRLGPAMARSCPDGSAGSAGAARPTPTPAPPPAPPAPVPPPPPVACRKPAADAKLSLSFKPDISLAELAVWIGGLTCKRVDFEADIPKGAATVTVIAPVQVTPKQAVQVFVDAIEAAGLAVTEKADAFAVKLGPKSPHGCADRVAAGSGSGPAAPQPGTPPDPPARPTSALDDAFLDASIRKIDDTHYEVKRALIDRVLDSPMEIAASTRMVPAMKNGRPEGFKLYAIRPGSLFSRLGFMNGDTVKTFGGHALTSADAALEAYTKLRGATRVEVGLGRRGADVTLTFTIVK
jgi:hypothetical protein